MQLAVHCAALRCGAARCSTVQHFSELPARLYACGNNGTGIVFSPASSDSFLSQSGIEQVAYTTLDTDLIRSIVSDVLTYCQAAWQGQQDHDTFSDTASIKHRPYTSYHTDALLSTMYLWPLRDQDLETATDPKRCCHLFSFFPSFLPPLPYRWLGGRAGEQVAWLGKCNQSQMPGQV